MPGALQKALIAPSGAPVLEVIGMSRFLKRKTTAAALTAIAFATAVGLFFAFVNVSQEHGPSNSPLANSARGDGSATIYVEVENSGVDFVHQTARPGTYFFPEIVGSGLALLDHDLDGDLDLYCVNLGGQYARKSYERSAPSQPMVNRFYEQVEVGKFVDKTRETGLGDSGIGMGVAVGDVNNDGYSDVYVTNYGKDRLYLNRGDKSFIDITRAAGIDNPRWGTSACFFDYDRDGWLDLYVCNYVEYYHRACTQVAGGGQDYCTPLQFPAAADKLFRNVTGEYVAAAGESSEPVARFEDVSISAGIRVHRGPGLGVTCADFNGDHWPDIYVANDQTANFLWINRHNGHFQEEAVLAGCATNAAGSAQASMGIAVGDLNNDTHLDVFLTHLAGEHHTLYLSEGNLVYQDGSLDAGMTPTNRYTGFGTALLDIEHDGDLDLVVVNGAVRRPSGKDKQIESIRYCQPLPEFFQTYAEPNQIFLNDGAQGFQKQEFSINEPFTAKADVSRGLAKGDVDNDGDVDLIVSNTAGPIRIFLNQAEKKGAWVKIRAVEPALGGRDAYGAKVYVHAGQRCWAAVVQPAASYLSSHDNRVHLGLGNVTRIDRLVVVWNDGIREEFPGGPVNRMYWLRRTQ